ncbi:MAG: hypothetical protein HEQ38_02315 [Gemmatimonas sp.]|jgi:lantibiotic modifying enzyme|nr:hypothetical protein [Gemmatimonas sp.]
MFNGQTGEAWMLAHLARATQSDRFAQVATDALASACAVCAEPSAILTYARRVGVGLTGLGSLLFALEDAGRALGDTALREAAANVVTAPLEEVFAEVGFTELYWGLPMLALGLMALPPTPTRDQRLRAIVAALKDAPRVLDPELGLSVWSPRFGRPQAGLAHGVTGVSLALVRAGSYLQDAEAVALAESAFALERACYRPATRAWADTRDIADAHTYAAWCHGAVGIGLARLSCLRQLPAHHGLATDLRLIADTLSTQRVAGPANLCCGWLGQVDFLVEASSMLDPALAVPAHRWGHSVATHVLTHGYRSLSLDEGVADGPGLWQGLAGIGYLMLRLHDPAVTSCLLTFERTPDRGRQPSAQAQ